MALDGFRAELAVGLVGDLIFGRCAAIGQRLARSSLKTAHDAYDHFLIQLFASETRARLDSRDVVARPGDLWVVDMLEPIAADSSTLSSLSLVVPRSLVEGGLREPGAHLQREIRCDAPTAQIFASHLRTLAAGMGDLPSAEAEQLVAATLRLTEALLNAGLGEPRAEVEPSAAEQALLFAARRLIEDRLADPDPGAPRC